jgi:ribosomal protein S18 acetylase RimI-like enzyme
MIRATKNDKQLVLRLLSAAFQDNKSVNYILRQDAKRQTRMQALMNYSFDVCRLFGDVFLSDDCKACALILLPERKKTTLKSIFLDAKLIVSATGFGNVKKAMEREKKIKAQHPAGLRYYLWFIGVDPSEQGKGIGSRLLSEVVAEGMKQKRTICLETSTQKNIPWYQKHGFTVYRELHFGYRLFCLKRE